MSDRDPSRRRPPEQDRWAGDAGATLWPRVTAALLVIAVIVAVNVVLLSPVIRRRAEYAFLHAQTAWKRLQPRDLYLPTPVLPAQTVSLPAAAPTPTPTVSAPAGGQPPLSTRSALPTPNQPPPAPPAPTPLPSSVVLETECHEPQGWNNCGPATVAMALRYYGWTENQYTVAQATKPDKNDKNVSPAEMAAYAFSLGDMYAYVGYAADQGVLKRLLGSGFPVIVETWFIPEPDDEMGHYRLLTGYDDVAQQYVTQDSYQGPNQSLSYGELRAHWKVFNRVYVVICEAERAQELLALLQDQGDGRAQARRGLDVALAEIAADSQDRYAWFNAGTNYLALGMSFEAVAAYDQARRLKLPYRMLWYQFGPFEAYLDVGRYQDVIDLANANLQAADNLEESYYYRALARKALGDLPGAENDLQAALRYNPLFALAARALNE